MPIPKYKKSQYDDTKFHHTDSFYPAQHGPYKGNSATTR